MIEMEDLVPLLGVIAQYLPHLRKLGLQIRLGSIRRRNYLALWDESLRRCVVGLQMIEIELHGMASSQVVVLPYINVARHIFAVIGDKIDVSVELSFVGQFSDSAVVDIFAYPIEKVLSHFKR